MNILRKYGIWALLIAVALEYFFAAGLSDGRLHVYALNIGQGDSLLIRTPSDRFILVDGGPDDSVLNQMADVMPFYRRDIALVILTHPHPDHVNGLVEVVRRYNVARVIMTGIDYHDAGYTAFMEAIAGRGVPVKFADGKDMVLGDDNGDGSDAGAGSGSGATNPDYGDRAVTLDFLYPLSSIQGRSFVNINNSSIVFRLIYGKTVILFEGDCEVECERKILESAAVTGADLSADVLKVGHHGSRTSSSEAMLDAVNPTYAVISCGVDNSFKHPHPETISKLQARGVRIYRTDIDGRVEFVSDGERVTAP